MQANSSHNCMHAGYYISSAITVPPASHIGTFGLSLTCVCILINSVVRYRVRCSIIMGCPPSSCLPACLLACLLVVVLWHETFVQRLSAWS